MYHIKNKKVHVMEEIKIINPKMNIMSYNIHKGFSRFKKLSIFEIKNQIIKWDPDIVFLQEVQGKNNKWEDLHSFWPKEGLHDFFAKDPWTHVAYGANALYKHGHHGNAILSKFPILSYENYNVSTSKLEQRGILHAIIDWNNISNVHLFCVHLSLSGKGRKWQLNVLAELVKNLPDNAPVIIAGDFNDWFNHAKKKLVKETGLNEVLKEYLKNTRSFPSEYPVLSLDRIYTKGFEITSGEIGKSCGKISDHAPVTASLVLKK